MVNPTEVGKNRLDVESLLVEKYIERLLEEIEAGERQLEIQADDLLLVEIGRKYENLGNYSKALLYYYRAADAGIVAVEVGVASVLMKKGDFIDGMAWLRQSAEKDNQEALHYLAQVYGETGDVELQKRCCLRLVELGDMSHCLTLARIFRDDMELETAVGFFEKAIAYEEEHVLFATKNDVSKLKTELLTLQKLLLLNPDPLKRLESINANYSRFARLAALKLGKLYYCGEEVAKDYELAAYWYSRIGD